MKRMIAVVVAAVLLLSAPVAATHQAIVPKNPADLYIEQGHNAVDRKCYDPYFDPFEVILYKNVDFDGKSLRLCRKTINDLHLIDVWNGGDSGGVDNTWGDLVSSFDLVKYRGECGPKEFGARWYFVQYRHHGLDGRAWLWAEDMRDLRGFEGRANDSMSSFSFECA